MVSDGRNLSEGLSYSHHPIPHQHICAKCGQIFEICGPQFGNLTEANLAEVTWFRELQAKDLEDFEEGRITDDQIGVTPSDEVFDLLMQAGITGFCTIGDDEIESEITFETCSVCTRLALG